MPLKSILRAVGRFLEGFPTPGSLATKTPPQLDLQRLTSRSDWSEGTPLDHARLIDPNFPNPPAWTQAMKPDLWPVTDDPYVDPEPCKVVQDEGLSMIRDYAARANENTRKLAERGLTGRLENLKIVSDILDLIERQDAAEKKLIEMGYIWNVKLKNWIFPLA